MLLHSPSVCWSLPVQLLEKRLDFDPYKFSTTLQLLAAYTVYCAVVNGWSTLCCKDTHISWVLIILKCTPTRVVLFSPSQPLSLQMMMSSSVLFVGERRQDSLPTENNRCGDAGDRRAFGSKAGAHRGRTGAGENQ